MTAVPIAGSGSIYRGPRFAAQRRSAALSCALRALRGGFSARWDRISTSASFAFCFALKEYSVAAARSMPNLAWPTGTGWFLGRPVAAFGQRSVVGGFASCCGDPRVLCWVNAFAGVDLTRRIAALAESPVLSRTARGSDATHDHSNTAAP